MILGIETVEEVDTQETLRSRIVQFDARLREQAEFHNVAVPHHLYVPLTVTSDVVLMDRLLRPCVQIGPDYLADEWGIEGVNLVYSRVFHAANHGVE